MQYIDTRILGAIKSVNCTRYHKGMFGKEQFIKISDLHTTRRKILRITKNDEFDQFTDKYGFIISKGGKKIYIDWKKVKHDYKGIYIKRTSLIDRYIDVPFRGQTFPSWIGYDFHPTLIHHVLIFMSRSKDESELGTPITKPFHGQIIDAYQLPESYFVHFLKKGDREKILFLDSLKAFDTFTATYGFLTKEKKINIDWHKVKKNFKGFYIDKQSDIESARYKIAFFQNTLYPSWLESNDIQIGVVYLFD